jgi:hypothetical protein
VTAYRFRFAPTALHWDEPDAGCVHCGEAVVTVDDHRCGTCLGLDLVHCPHCLGRIVELVEREVARRWRQASHDVNDEWTSTKMLDRVTAAVQAEVARGPQGAALRRDKLRERLYGEQVPS